MVQPGATQTSQRSDTSGDSRKHSTRIAANSNRASPRSEFPPASRAVPSSSAAPINRNPNPAKQSAPINRSLRATMQPRAPIKISERTARSLATTAPPPARDSSILARRHKTASRILRPGHPARPDFKSRPAAAGGRPSKPPFSKPFGAKSHGPNHSTQNRAAKNRAAPGNRAHPSEGKAPAARNHTAAASHSRNSAPILSSRPDQDSDYDRPIKPKSEAPWRRTESQQPSGRPSGGPGSKFRKFPPPAAAANPAPPGNRASPQNPAHSAAPKANSPSPGGRPTGMKPRPDAGAPKRSDSRPGQHKPKPGNFTGPKGRR